MRRDVQVHAGHDAFFIAGVGGEEELRKEVFFLAYHLHWSHSEIMDLDTLDRQAYVRLLVEQIERENAQIEASRRR